MELKDKCIEIRNILQITQYGLAEKLGTNQTKISLIEMGYMPKDKNIEQKINKLYTMLFAKFNTYNEFMKFIADNTDEIQYILDYDDFAVVEIINDIGLHEYWFYSNEEETYCKVEIMAELTYDVNNDLQIKDETILHTLFDCYCCGEQVKDNGIKYLWFKAVV